MLAIYETDSTIYEHVLTNVVIILEKILKNLNARELNTCARVCKVWQVQVKKEKASRKQMCWNCFFLGEGGDEDAVREEWWNSVNSFILTSAFEPKNILMFCTDTLWCCLTEESQHRKRRKRFEAPPSALLPSSVPKDCVLNISLTDGIIATDDRHKTEEHGEYEKCLVMLLFGQIPDVEFVPFSCTHAECLDMPNYWAGTSTKIPRFLQRLVRKEVKMINLFCPMNGIDNEIGYSLFRMFNWPLLCGGCVNAKYVLDKEGTFLCKDSQSVMSGLAICGPQVQVASVLIRSEVETEEEADEIIKQLQDFQLPLENSFGLMYACVGRGVHVYDKKDVESKAFKKYFPKTPLFGFFGNGELGTDFPQADPLYLSQTQQKSGQFGAVLDSVNSPACESNGDLSTSQLKRQVAEMRQKSEEYKLKHPPKLLHAYSTVMCLVSLP